MLGGDLDHVLVTGRGVATWQQRELIHVGDPVVLRSACDSACLMPSSEVHANDAAS
jgi:hypothetical protein